MNLPISGSGVQTLVRNANLSRSAGGSDPLRTPFTLLFPAFHRLPVQRFRRKLGEFDTDAVGVRDVG
jgi:hypothetical protein